MKRSQLFAITFFLGMTLTATAQDDDLLSLLGDDEPEEYVTGSFKTDHVINLHSLENTAAGELDIKISHRFGAINEGKYTLFGLDGPATIRIGADYGITDRLNIGIGRSSWEKTFDGFVKFKFLRQSKGTKNTPITACILGSTAITTLKPPAGRVNYFSSKLFYTGQLILGRKFSKVFSLQLSPTIVHRNLVTKNIEKNDVFAIGAGARLKLGKRTSINVEYIYVPPDQIDPKYRNSMSIGFDIETGGHVFQIHFTNSNSMIEKGFIAETSPNEKLEPGQKATGIGDVRFGFNISRTFNIVK
jgi:hypothetical protein